MCARKELRGIIPQQGCMQMVLESFAATGLSSDAQWTCALSKTQ